DPERVAADDQPVVGGQVGPEVGVDSFRDVYGHRWNGGDATRAGTQRPRISTSAGSPTATGGDRYATAIPVSRAGLMLPDVRSAPHTRGGECPGPPSPAR